MNPRVSTPSLRSLILTGAALTFSFGLSASPASALDTIFGGFASGCARNAKVGSATNENINGCTDALMSELLTERDRAATMVNRGTLYLVRQNWDAAKADFDMAARIQPKMGESYVNRGAALIGMGRLPEAEAQITYGLTFNPELPERAYYNRALARWRMDNVKGAYFDFRKALELKPGWEDATKQLAYFTVSPAR
ncbi:MAG: tetratricopeptide repeat protein [Caulobacteraceae bacterium]